MKPRSFIIATSFAAAACLVGAQHAAPLQKEPQQLQEQVRPQFQALHEETRDRIRKILNPDQVARFDEINRQFEQRMRQRMRP